MSPPKSMLLGAILGCIGLQPLRADEITDQIQAATQAYTSGHLRIAVQTLQFATAAIQEKINRALLQLLPDPLPGWQADEPEAMAGGIASLLAGTHLSRRYFHREGGGEVTISITADSPFLSMMTLFFSNPILLQSDPDTRLYRYEGRQGLIERDRDARGWEISLLVGHRILIQVSGTGVEKSVVEAYLQHLDLDAVARAFSA